MDLAGEYRIAAPRKVVWAAMNTPDVPKACIPGCIELVKMSDTTMKAKVSFKICSRLTTSTASKRAEKFFENIHAQFNDEVSPG